MCFERKDKGKKLDAEFFYIVSALHIDEEQLKASSIDELVKNIYVQLKPFLPCIELDSVLLEEYLMFSIKQQAVWGAYMRARNQMMDTYLGTREIVFLGKRGFEETNKYIQNATEDIKNGQRVEGVYLDEKLYGHKMFYNDEPLPGSKYAKQSKGKRKIAISAFRNKLGELKKLDCYSRVFLGINPDEKRYNYPVYSANKINELLFPLTAFEKKLSRLTNITKFDMSEKNQKIVLDCYKAHQNLASCFKPLKTDSSSAAIRDALAFNYELENYYHVEYLQKAMEERKKSRSENYIYETMLENMLIANAELPNPFFRDVIVKKEIECHKTRFYHKKNKGVKNQLVTFYEEEDIRMSEFESILHWAKKAMELPRIMNKLVYPAAEILLCHALATDGGYEHAFTILKRYLSDNRIFWGKNIESFYFQNQTTNTSQKS